MRAVTSRNAKISLGDHFNGLADKPGFEDAADFA